MRCSNIVEKKSYFSENIGSKFAFGSAMWRMRERANSSRFVGSLIVPAMSALSKTVIFVFESVAMEKMSALRVAISRSVESKRTEKSPCFIAL